MQLGPPPWAMKRLRPRQPMCLRGYVSIVVVECIAGVL